MDRPGRLLAISDLHVGFPENHEFVRQLRPDSPEDWLIVAGDVAESFDDIEWVLLRLAERYARVFWVPGNHELWTPANDRSGLRGAARYLHLVELCRSLGVVTPEDPWQTWTGPGGPAVVVPMFLLYDYTWRPLGASTKDEAMRRAEAANVLCTDEFMLHPDPFPTREAWCARRLAVTRKRLASLPAGTKTVLVNHYPLVREPTRVLRHQEFAIWCGTEQTTNWHNEYDAIAMVHGHLHIPGTFRLDDTEFNEVSLGYPTEWQRRSQPADIPRQILPRVA